MKLNRKMNKKNIIVTGGCGLLGWEFSTSLSNKGHNVFILEKSRKKIQEKKLLSENKIKFYPCDITNEKEVDKIISTIKKKYNSIDVLINNACVNLSPMIKNKNKNDFINFSLTQFDKELNVGLKGSVICCKIVGKYMLKQKKVL